MEVSCPRCGLALRDSIPCPRCRQTAHVKPGGQLACETAPAAHPLPPAVPLWTLDLSLAFHPGWWRVRWGLQILELGLMIHLLAGFVLLLCLWTRSKSWLLGLTHQVLVVLEENVLYPAGGGLLVVGVILGAQVPRQAGARLWQWGLLGGLVGPPLVVLAF